MKPRPSPLPGRLFWALVAASVTLGTIGLSYGGLDPLAWCVGLAAGAGTWAVA